MDRPARDGDAMDRPARDGDAMDRPARAIRRRRDGLMDFDKRIA